MSLSKSQLPVEEKLNQRLTTDSIPKSVVTLEQTKSKSEKPSKRYRGVCVDCGKPKTGRGERCWECYLKRKNTDVELTCSRCGKKYTVPQYVINKQKKRGVEKNYCSKECSCQDQADQQRTKQCPICGRYPGGGNRKYCSDECKKIGLKKQRKLQYKTCPICGEVFYPHSVRRVYCSRECASKAHSARMKGKGNSHYKDGSSYTKDFYDIKPEILKRDEYHCQKCGKEMSVDEKGRWNHQVNLHVHHIDMNPKNNSPKNLITLCDSCHVALHKTKK